ncbi:MAG: PilZ domain-containing protein [Kofleriaceae bacterium]|nr:PilZ domain-containing protein [Kofleriaceae bacterium]MCB9573910.1 PilZ domain-containing protein [Kofleriaceae bacterium]
MTSLRRWMIRMGLLTDRRDRGDRTPIFVGARLELDVVSLTGVARDIGTGGVFFATSVPLAPGLRGRLSREDGRERIPVRVSWCRQARGGDRGGIGLAFD